jgi:hypothetical protein
MDVLTQQKPQTSTVVTTPTTITMGDVAATGTATDYARGDHGHALPPDYRVAFLMLGG